MLSLSYSPIGKRWSRYELLGDTLVVEGEPRVRVAAFRDSLVFTGVDVPLSQPAVQYRMTRLQGPARSPRPDRISLLTRRGWVPHPSFEFEVDSSGTVYLHRLDSRPSQSDNPPVGYIRSEHVLDRGDDLGGRYGSYVGTGHRALYEHLSELAVSLQADRMHDTSGEHDAYTMWLGLRYDGRVQIHYGADTGYDELWLLVSELYRAARDTQLEPTSTRHPFYEF